MLNFHLFPSLLILYMILIAYYVMFCTLPYAFNIENIGTQICLLTSQIYHTPLPRCFLLTSAIHPSGTSYTYSSFTNNWRSMLPLVDKDITPAVRHLINIPHAHLHFPLARGKPHSWSFYEHTNESQGSSTQTYKLHADKWLHMQMRTAGCRPGSDVGLAY